MESRPNRRSFLKRSASLILIGAHRGTSAGASQPARLPALPKLDGDVLYDTAARRVAADDWGHYVHRAPRAVLNAASPADVAAIVAYANRHQLSIAMRGQGHCVHGQAQAFDGIVIDSTRLNAIGWPGGDRLDAQPGALWSAVAKAALERGLTPPVMPDALMLSVGGTLSAGGTGDTSCRAGAQGDHVLELDVVTGRGDLVTCSPTVQEELFQMVLAGLGQCGIIVRARLRLAGAPAYIVLSTLTCDDWNVLLAEQTRLATAEAVPIVAGEGTRDGDGRWRVRLITGTFAQQPTNQTGALPYWDYLDRRTASVAATKAKGTPNPSLAVMLPADAVAPFLAHVVSDPEAAAGIWRIEVLPMVTKRFTLPLLVLPPSDLGFSVRLQRRASAENAADHRVMLVANDRLVHRCMAAGGRIYPPLAPVLSRENWTRHYGPQVWQRFAAAKARFDPNNVLTPGAGVFVQPTV